MLKGSVWNENVVPKIQDDRRTLLLGCEFLQLRIKLFQFLSGVTRLVLDRTFSGVIGRICVWPGIVRYFGGIGVPFVATNLPHWWGLRDSASVATTMGMSKNKRAVHIATIKKRHKGKPM